jgi:hypothetical protein
MKKIYFVKYFFHQPVHTDYKKYGTVPEPRAEQTVDLKKVDQVNKHINDLLADGKLLTFSTEYMPFQLKKLRLELISDNFIFDDITENQFCHIFTGQLMTDFVKPIKWKGSKESLRFFLELLIPGIVIHKYQVANCFVDVDNKPIIISKPNRTKAVSHAIKARFEKIIYKM